MTIIYCVSAPAGVAIGVGVQHSYGPNSAKAKYFQGIFDSIAAGIVMYIAFVQMLGIEFRQDVRQAPGQWRKALLFVCLWIGALVTSIVGRWL